MLNLPSDSETAEACEGWHKPRRVDLSSLVVELAHVQVLQARALAGDKSVRQMKPLQIPRPWEPHGHAPARRRRRPTKDSGEIKRFFS